MKSRRQPHEAARWGGRATKAQAVETGVALAFAFLLVGLLRDKWGWFVAAAVALAVNMVAPVLFSPAARVWFGLSRLLGAAMSRAFLALAFFCVVVPVAALRRRLGKDTLGLKAWKNDDGSAFVERDHRYTSRDMEHPY